jgi:hypothetical protein
MHRRLEALERVHPPDGRWALAGLDIPSPNPDEPEPWVWLPSKEPGLDVPLYDDRCPEERAREVAYDDGLRRLDQARADGRHDLTSRACRILISRAIHEHDSGVPEVAVGWVVDEVLTGRGRELWAEWFGPPRLEPVR